VTRACALALACAVALALAAAGCGLFDGAAPDDASAGEPCGEAECAPGLDCCGDRCVNLRNDVAHCGACNEVCGGTTPFCSAGVCAQTPCNPGVVCGAALCCGDACCGAGEICCEVDRGGPRLLPECVAPSPTGSCPIDCPLCR
jgi:Stigma-specific protein, Stig1